jgi:hypothetical protein
LENELKDYFAAVEGSVEELLQDKPLEYHQKTGIVGEVSKSEWTTYYQYLKLIKEGYEDFKKYTYKRPHIKGVHLRSLAVNALIEANKHRRGSKLYNLWDRLEVAHPIGAYADFIDNPQKEYLWRLYVSDETMNRSIFRDSDQVRLTNIMISQQILNKSLVKHGFLA